jgi:hypothetical protein
VSAVTSLNFSSLGFNDEHPENSLIAPLIHQSISLFYPEEKKISLQGITITPSAHKEAIAKKEAEASNIRLHGTTTETDSLQSSREGAG